jgi:DNA-binding winged helix-turn-helix (wHTH) protein
MRVQCEDWPREVEIKFPEISSRTALRGAGETMRKSIIRVSFRTPTGRLWSGKREVRLTPKAAAVLDELIAHAGEPVSKETLFASVWPDTVVSDDALTSCIQELRKALVDDPKQPRFIETRHRRGYRFVASLLPAPDDETADQPKTLTTKDRGVAQRRAANRSSPCCVTSAVTAAGCR